MWRSIAAARLRAGCPSGNAPTTRVRRLISRRSSGLLGGYASKCSSPRPPSQPSSAALERPKPRSFSIPLGQPSRGPRHDVLAGVDRVEHDRDLPHPGRGHMNSRCCGTNAQTHRFQAASGKNWAALSARPIQASDMISRTPLRPRRSAAKALGALYARGTFFVTSIALEKQLEFCWDQLEAIVTSPSERDTLELHLDGARKEFDLGSRRDRRQAHTRRAVAPPRPVAANIFGFVEDFAPPGEASAKNRLVHLATNRHSTGAARSAHDRC